MSETRHLTDEELVRTLDGELTVFERAKIDEHLVRCELCLERYEALAEFSSDIEMAINGTAVRPPRDSRERLIAAMESGTATSAAPARGRRRAWQWSAAAAASVAIASLALYRPQPTPKQEDASVQEVQSRSSAPAPTQVEAPAAPAQREVPSSFRAASKGTKTAAEANTSGFMRLPYADTALPMQTAGLVRVRMQLSMLARAGVIQMSPGAPDAPVEADLLLGIDGQPYAVRLVSANK
jgi:hypothetical protein